MVDIVDAISTSIDMVKRLRELNKTLSEAEFKMYLAELTSDLGDAKLEAANLKIELAAAKSRVIDLEKQAEQRAAAEPEVHEGAYVFGDDGRHYCTACYDIRNCKVLMDRLTGPWASFGTWKCPSCDKTFGPST